jgi:hypothetical protein
LVQVLGPMENELRCPIIQLSWKTICEMFNNTYGCFCSHVQL